MKSPVFVTGNMNKVEYLRRTLDIELEHHPLDLDEIQSTDPKEIAEHKVRQAYDILKRPVLIEDTSSGFNALNGLPGPFMKYFLQMDNALEKMCRMLDAFDDRSAYATAVYAYYDGRQLEFFVGRIDGIIADHPRGKGGFGWDAIFEPEGYGGLTRAELNEEQDVESYNKIRDLEGLRRFLLS